MCEDIARNDFMREIRKAHDELNRLLMSAYQHQLKCELSINNPLGCDNDTRQVIGINIYDIKTVYSESGIC